LWPAFFQLWSALLVPGCSSANWDWPKCPSHDHWPDGEGAASKIYFKFQVQAASLISTAVYSLVNDLQKKLYDTARWLMDKFGIMCDVRKLKKFRFFDGLKIWNQFKTLIQKKLVKYILKDKLLVFKQRVERHKNYLCFDVVDLNPGEQLSFSLVSFNSEVTQQIQSVGAVTTHYFRQLILLGHLQKTIN
jgi:hypothetical protein